VSCDARAGDDLIDADSDESLSIEQLNCRRDKPFTAGLWSIWKAKE